MKKLLILVLFLVAISVGAYAQPIISDLKVDGAVYQIGMECFITPLISFNISEEGPSVLALTNMKVAIDGVKNEDIPFTAFTLFSLNQGQLAYTITNALSVGRHDLVFTFDSTAGSGQIPLRVKVGAPEAMLIYPNPVRAGNAIMVQIDSEENVSGHLQLIGPQIFPYKSELKNLTAGTTTKFNIDTTDLPNAMYYAIFSDLNGRIRYKTKLVVAN